MNLPSSLTTVTTTSRRLALLILIVLPVAGFLFGRGYERSVAPQGSSTLTYGQSSTTSSGSEATSSSDLSYLSDICPVMTDFGEKVGGIYTNPEKTFRLVFPDGWRLVSTQGGAGCVSKSYIFSGTEGLIRVDYGAGFGGQCDDTISVELKTKSTTGCRAANGIRMIYAELGDTSFEIDVYFESATKSAILGILKTFEPIGQVKWTDHLIAP